MRSIGELCDIYDGLSPTLATTPGEFPMVVSAFDRRTADHFDYDGEAICVPIVSSAGHGKAEIKRIHYQEGQFALATTMCALFSKDTDVLRSRFLHIYLNAVKDEVLKPLMCGATNVTLDSGHLKDVLIPLPGIDVQDEVIEAFLIDTTVGELKERAELLRSVSGRKDVGELAEHIIFECDSVQEHKQSMTDIRHFMPA